MIALRRIAITLLALLGAAAAAGAVVWAASLAGLAHPVAVATGALEPQVRAGDLLIVTPLPVAELERGDVVAVRSAGSGPLAPERIVGAERAPDGSWSITTSAGASDRTAVHSVGAEAWAPTLQVPLVGGVAGSVLEPEVGLPLLAVVGLLVAVLLVARAPAGRSRAPLGARAEGLRP